MGKKPNLNNLDYLFKQGKSFKLTDSQYEKKTGVALPKSKSYILNNSALSRKCADEGYTIRVQEKIVYIDKINID